APAYVVEYVHTVTGPEAVRIGDLTGDGRPDLAYTTAWAFGPHPDDNKIFVRAQQPDGTLAPPVRYEPVQSARVLAIADVDQDGRLDLVTGGGRLEWFRQDENGSLVSQGFLSDVTDVRILEAADLDGDNDTDLVGVVGAGGSG